MISLPETNCQPCLRLSTYSRYIYRLIATGSRISDIGRREGLYFTWIVRLIQSPYTILNKGIESSSEWPGRRAQPTCRRDTVWPLECHQKVIAKLIEKARLYW